MLMSDRNAMVIWQSRIVRWSSFGKLWFAPQLFMWSLHPGCQNFDKKRKILKALFLYNGYRRKYADHSLCLRLVRLRCSSWGAQKIWSDARSTIYISSPLENLFRIGVRDFSFVWRAETADFIGNLFHFPAFAMKPLEGNCWKYESRWCILKV